jgi:hypothetical protein
MTDASILQSTIRCPVCGSTATEPMPVDACVFFYECRACRTVLRPRAGDCCVFCSYGTAPCPPRQGGACCDSGEEPAA